MLLALQIFCILLCVAWIAAFVYLIRSVRYLPVLSEQETRTPSLWPRLSVVVPACNEAPHLESAVLTLTQQDYPDLEIVLVDDRSTDNTGKIIDRLGQNDPRIRPVHVETLLSGWLGKVHALHRGVEEASGDWLLFTDADVHFFSRRFAPRHRLCAGSAHRPSGSYTAHDSQKFLARSRGQRLCLVFPYHHPRRRHQPARQQSLRGNRRV